MKCSHTHVVKIKQEDAIANCFPGGLASSDDLAAAHAKAEVKDELKVEENNFNLGVDDRIGELLDMPVGRLVETVGSNLVTVKQEDQKLVKKEEETQKISMEHQRKHEHETKLDIENMKLRVKRLKVELSALEDIEKMEHQVKQLKVELSILEDIENMEHQAKRLKVELSELDNEEALRSASGRFEQWIGTMFQATEFHIQFQLLSNGCKCKKCGTLFSFSSSESSTWQRCKRHLQSQKHSREAQQQQQQSAASEIL